MLTVGVQESKIAKLVVTLPEHVSEGAKLKTEIVELGTFTCKKRTVVVDPTIK
jgi:hypothetical protein